MARDYVVDTSAFLTEEMREQDEDLEKACRRLVDTVSENGEDEFYIPATIFEELKEILEGSVDGELLKSIKAEFTVKSPARHEIEVPGDMLYNFVKEMRERSYRGLRVAEDSVKELAEMEEEPEKEHYEKHDVVISDLRDKYKEKLRKGIVDSEQDLDLLLLAREVDGEVVTEDQGVIEWAEELGIPVIKGREFPEVLRKRMA